jgi:acyl-CoA reductase-like NAD-dependent aldehyde dehydrogenase
MNYVEVGRKEGARLLGGKALTTKGYFVAPTVFTDVDNSMGIAREEIFGPVAVVIPFKDDNDAIL